MTYDRINETIDNLLRDADADDRGNAPLYEAQAREARTLAAMRRAQAVALYKNLPSILKGSRRSRFESQLRKWSRVRRIRVSVKKKPLAKRTKAF